MATIKQLADAEAERAEAEAEAEAAAEAEALAAADADAEPEPEPEPEPEAEPEPVTEQQLDRAAGEVERAGDAYTEHVKAIQHETPLGLVECPLCLVPGFVSEQPMAEVDPMQRLAVLTVLGEPSTQRGPDHPSLHRCERCDGFGLMPTGSRRPEYENAPCPSCGGNGYMDRAVEQAQADARAATQLPPGFDQVPPPAPNSHVVPVPTVTQGGHTFPLVLGGSVDQIGRLAGHPLWGQPSEMGGL